MAKVTGIGGIFFKSRNDNKALAAWYQEHLGFDIKDFGGAVFNWSEDPAQDAAYTVWHVADKDTEWFSPSDSSFMVNYRVDDMEALLAKLANAGIEPVGGPETHAQGIFAWIMDPEGNKLELWEPKPEPESDEG